MKEKISILYQDDYFVVCEKRAQLLVHPTPELRNERITLLSLLRDQTQMYLYPMHRLDRKVSGIVIFGLQKEATQKLMQSWNTDEVTKKYILLCKGKTDLEGSFDFALQDDYKNKKECKTLYKTLYHFEDTSLCEVSIKTGRRHQIRRHFARRHHNLVGDRKHGRSVINNEYLEKFKLDRLFLHSHSLSFIHPYTNEKITLNSKLPSELSSILINKGIPKDFDYLWK